MRAFIPAWIGGEPEFATFDCKVDNKIGELIRKISATHFNLNNALVCGKLNQPEHLIGHYLVQSSTGEKFVIHVKELAGGRELEFANKITQHCVLHGVNTNIYIPNKNNGVEIEFQGTFINCTKYIDGQHLPLDIEIAEKLGLALSKLHFALKQTNCLSRKVKNASLKRQKQIKKNIEFSKSNLSNFKGQYLDIIKEALKNYQLTYGNKRGQICHGDLNTGNLIYTKESEICFIDFNDTLFSWHDPLFDVATCYLRYCWKDKTKGNELSSAFLNSYSASQMIKYSLDSVKKAARNMIYQNIIVIIGSGINPHYKAAELSKFNNLLLKIRELDDYSSIDC